MECQDPSGTIPKISFTRQDMVKFLESSNIETRSILPLLSQPVYKQIFGDIGNNYPVAKWIDSCGFYVGTYPELSPEQLDYMTDKIIEFVDRYR